METDCVLLVRAFNSRRNSSPLEMLAMDVQFLAESFDSFSFSHINREANKVTHYLAKHGGDFIVQFCNLSFLGPLLHLANADYQYLLNMK